MRKGIALLVVFFQLFGMTGCASIMHGKQQTIRVETNPPGAMVQIERTKTEMVTPANLVLKRKHEYELKIEKPGFKTEYVTINKNIGGWFWGNLFFGGLIGIIVDLSNGAAYNLDPEEIRVVLKPERVEGV